MVLLFNAYILFFRIHPKTMKKIHFEWFLAILLFYFDGAEGALGASAVIRAYPCVGQADVLETFETLQPVDDENKFRLSVNTNKIATAGLSSGSIVHISFDTDVTLALDNDFGTTRFISVGEFEITILRSGNQGFSMTVRGVQGRPVPNLIELTIDAENLCPKGFRKGYWDDFILNDEFRRPTVVETKPRLPAMTSVPVAGSCGKRQILINPLITSGYTTKPGDWPWHVALYRRPASSIASLHYICGGSLISTTRIITAGHCIIENGNKVVASRFTAFLGKFNFIGEDEELQQKSIRQTILHPSYDPAILSNDIALLALSTEARLGRFVQTVCLWPADKVARAHVNGQQGYVVGWGHTGEAQFSEVLLEARMPVVVNTQCILSKPEFYNKFVRHTSFCAGFRNGTSACNGDSGGGMFFPLQSPHGDSSWYLRGIVSLSVNLNNQNRCNPNEYAVFTDSAEYLDWIESNMVDRVRRKRRFIFNQH